MRVLIVGEGKSGTTALLRSVSSAIGDPTEIFEPQRMEAEDLVADPLVVKKLLLNWKPSEYHLLDHFDKRLFIVRDPRDRLVSHLLYDAYNRASGLDEHQRERWLTLLQRKVERPTAVSFVHLINAWWRLTRSDLLSHYVRSLDRSLAFQRRTRSEFSVVPYEQYVDGEFGPLRDYLGLSIEQGVVRGSEDRVSRSRTYGAWRHWFTKADIAVFRPMSHNWLGQSHIDPRDWTLASPTEIDDATSVRYVRGLFDRVPLPGTR